MVNCYGFDGSIPEAAVAGVYDAENGEWTGDFFNNFEAATEAEDELDPEGDLCILDVNDSGWVSRY